MGNYIVVMRSVLYWLSVKLEQLWRSLIPSQRLPWHVRYHVSPDDDDDDDDDELSQRTIRRSAVPATRSTLTFGGSEGFAQPTTVKSRLRYMWNNVILK